MDSRNCVQIRLIEQSVIHASGPLGFSMFVYASGFLASECAISLAHALDLLASKGI
ncbi:MAG TPA: hypothetical protein VEH06_04585 [Candidatus Bathyarchaeia archaeon]|nr:hypothetical protein [Candidatus Bathyarchaeia archaeon]